MTSVLIVPTNIAYHTLNKFMCEMYFGGEISLSISNGGTKNMPSKVNFMVKLSQTLAENSVSI